MARKVDRSENHTKSLKKTGIEKAEGDGNSLLVLQHHVYVRVVGVVVIITVPREFFLLVKDLVGCIKQKFAFSRRPGAVLQLPKTWQFR